MKRIKALLVALVITTLVPINVYASDIMASSKIDNTPYTFPIKPGTAEWAKLESRIDKVNISQIPGNKLETMTTEALLETVLNYPLLPDYTAYNTIEEACSIMSNDFNGFNELFSRSDITKVLLNRYRESEVFTKFDKSISARKFLEHTSLEYLLACSKIINGEFTADEQEIFLELFAEKAEKRSEAGIYASESDLQSRNDTEQEPGSVRVRQPLGTVKTPRGTSVYEVYIQSPDFTDTQREVRHAIEEEIYPNAIRLGEATVRYNCYSYSFYWSSTANPYIVGYLFDPAEYYNDGSYIPDVSGTYTDETKLVYRTPGKGSHIANVEGYNSNGSIQVISKWGKDALYSHSYIDCPYYEANTTLTYYVRNTSK